MLSAAILANTANPAGAVADVKVATEVFGQKFGMTVHAVRTLRVVSKRL